MKIRTLALNQPLCEDCVTKPQTAMQATWLSQPQRPFESGQRSGRWCRRRIVAECGNKQCCEPCFAGVLGLAILDLLGC